MKNHSNTIIDQNELDLIIKFEKELEQIFSSETKVVICKPETHLLRLAIEMESNLSLSEVISLLYLPYNGKHDLQTANLKKVTLRLQAAVFDLNQSLCSTLEIEEFSIYFKNTSVTIHSIERNSVIEEFEYIIHSVFNHFEHFSTLMGEVPNEIHIPVIDYRAAGELFEKDNQLKPVKLKSPYSQYWGLYFDSQKAPMIYNLERTNITPGDLDLYLD